MDTSVQRHAHWRADGWSVLRMATVESVDAAGVVYAPHGQSRISGTQLSTQASPDGQQLKLDSWLMKDTSNFLDLPR